MREAIRSPIRLPIGPLVRPSPRLDSTAYALGAVVTFGGFMHRCVFAGTSDVAEPTVISPVGSGDVITNGGFDADTDWVKGVGWSIAAGVASHAAGTGSALGSTAAAKITATYLHVFTLLNYIAGTVTPRAGANGTGRSANGTFTELITAAAATTIDFLAGSTFDGDIDNVSAIEVTKDGTAAWETIG